MKTEQSKQTVLNYPFHHEQSVHHWRFVCLFLSYLMERPREFKA